jgi:hypothetical protein
MTAGNHLFHRAFPLQYVMESRYSRMHRRGRFIISCWPLNAVVLLPTMEHILNLYYKYADKAPQPVSIV